MTYKFFWGGKYSNFHPCTLEAAGSIFTNSEQYFMFCKAMYFNDMDSAKKILKTPDPKAAKRLGRGVKDFDADKWSKVSEVYMWNAIYYKFTQNPELKHALLTEKADLFVEASPYDKIWGIGLSEEEAKRTPEAEWPGENRLGQLLTKLRTVLKEENV